MIQTLDEIKTELQQIREERNKIMKMEDIEESIRLDKPLYERERDLLAHPLMLAESKAYWQKRDKEITAEVEAFKKAGGYVTPAMLWGLR